MTSKWFRVCLLVGAAAGSCIVLALGAWILFAAWRLPADAPLARMYRTEADLASLVKVVQIYRDNQGVYPPAGEAGLALAVKNVSRVMDYFPDGPPPDGWGRTFCYVPSSQYGEADAGAVKENGSHVAPGTFQLYSMGEDGNAGLDDPAKRQDNIVSWDSHKAWRTVYGQRNAAYMQEKGRSR